MGGAVLDGSDEAIVEDTVGALLVVAQRPDWREPLLDVLIEATESTVRRLSLVGWIASRSLRVTSHYWPENPENEARDDRHAVSDAVRAKIDLVHPASDDS